MRTDSLGSTYRLQLHQVGLAGARELVPYLAALGIDTLYLSPILAAVPGSSHGYDVVDPLHLDPEIGSEQEFDSLLNDLGAHGMRVLLDIVPNHMAAHPANARWWDVLRSGPSSSYASFFDIDWSRHGGRVLVPALGHPLADVIEAGSITSDGLLELDDQRFPLAEGTQGEPGGALPDLLARQHYRPAYWRTGNTEGNYRRFFDISGLVGVRVEDADVFKQTHGLTLSLCRDPRVAGVRVDHVDGLWDPTGYLDTLCGALADEGRPDGTVLVEKVLGQDETLDPRWPVTGTTGYEFMDQALGLFLDDEGCRRLAHLGSAMTGEAARLAELAAEAKREALERSFPADRDRLARLTREALDVDEPGHDLSELDLQRAWTNLTVRLDVYRTYLDGDQPSPSDRRRLAGATAVRTAMTEGWVAVDAEVERATHLIVEALVHRATPGSPWLAIARRWQQLSGAVMAKGVEDTAVYRYPGLLTQADVGSDPDRPGGNATAFHRLCRGRTGLNASSTHDSKRSEDARCRLAVLSETSDAWDELVARWHRRFLSLDGPSTPAAAEELVIYQSVLALWPADGDRLERQSVRRLQDYMIKAVREGKRRSSWSDPDVDYERTVRAFVVRLDRDERFRHELTRFLRRIGPASVTNVLALLTLKVCAPGTPDFYQGSELFAPTLTDPDNRRVVDFGAHAAMLSQLPAVSASAARDLLSHWSDGRIKLYVTTALLGMRRNARQLFAHGTYHPLATSSEHVIAFARRRGPQVALCLVPRLTYRFAGPGRFATGRRVWESETVSVPSWASGTFEDVLTAREIECSNGILDIDQAFGILPVATLVQRRQAETDPPFQA
jgi:malto-oligosyltrehalose synthase